MAEKIWLSQKGSDVSIIDVISNPTQEIEHMMRIFKSDTSYPILISYRDDYSFDILDGMHRLAKIFLLKKDDSEKFIDVKIIITVMVI